MTFGNTMAGLVAVASAALLHPAVAAAEVVNVVATGALQGAMQKLKPAYEKKTGHTLHIVWGPSFGPSPESIPSRLKAHEPMDVTIGTAETIETLGADGYFALPTRRVIAESRIGVGVPAGAPKPDISTVAAFRQALLNAGKVAYSQGASGVFIGGTLLPKLGLVDALKDKTVIAEGKELVGTVLARKEADIGMQQVSELRVTPGVDYVGPLPAEVQKVSRFTAVLAATPGHAAAAKSFIAFLTSAAARPLLTASGLEPVTTQRK
jgi:molybdate transport system substrate-binding protein